MMLSYRKPNGDYTDDAQEYGNAWIELGNKLEIKFDVTVVGYDPHIRIVKRGQWVGTCIDLPMWFVEKLLAQ